MEYILKIFQLKYILLQFSVLFLHVGMNLVWLGLGKDHVCAANSWKSSSMSKIYECYDSATFCSVTQQHDHQLINVKCSRDTERLVEMSDTVHKKKKTYKFDSRFRRNVKRQHFTLLVCCRLRQRERKNWKKSPGVLNVVSV